MKKILFVCPSLAAGGAERAAVAISNYLVETNKYDIYFLTFLNDMFLKQSLNNKVKFIKRENILGTKEYSSKTIDNTLQFKETIKKYEFDIIISTNELTSELPIIFSKIFITKKTKIVTVIQNTTKQLYSDYNLKSKILYYFVTLLRKYIFNKVIAVNQHIKNELKNHKNITVISNPLTIDESYDSIKQKFYDDNKKEKYFISVSRISKQKNLQLLIKAYKLIEKETKNKLIIIGSIGEESEYLRLIELVEFLDLTSKVKIETPSKDYLKLLINAEAFLFTSRYEGFPLSILEAMYCKVPIISTRFKGYEQILDSRRCILVDEFSPEFFARAIRDFEKDGVNDESLNISKEYSEQYRISNIGNLYHKTLLNL